MIWGLPLFQETTKWMFSRICLTERGLFDGFPLPSGQVTFECEEKRRKPLYFPSTTFKTYSNVFFLFSLTPISWIFEEGGVSPSIQKDKCAGQVIIIQLHDVKIQVGMAQPEIPRAYSWQTCANDIKCVWYPNFRVPHKTTETFHPQNPDVARWAMWRIPPDMTGFVATILESWACMESYEGVHVEKTTHVRIPVRKCSVHPKQIDEFFR